MNQHTNRLQINKVFQNNLPSIRKERMDKWEKENLTNTSIKLQIVTMNNELNWYMRYLKNRYYFTHAGISHERKKNDLEVRYV